MSAKDPGAEFQAELWGVPGAGKTALAASILAHLRRLPDVARYEIKASPAIEKLASDLSGTDASEAPPRGSIDYLSFLVRDETGRTPFRLRITAIHGEGTRGVDAGGRPERFIAERQKRLLVACYNPFLTEPVQLHSSSAAGPKGLALRGLLGMISTLQTRAGLNIRQAIVQSALALFHLQPHDLESYFQLQNVLKFFDHFEGKPVQLVYHPRWSERHGDDGFEWNDGDPTANRELADELEIICERIVERAGPLTESLRSLVKKVDSAIVVLTHLDLMQFIPSVEMQDIEAAFDHGFAGRDARLVWQQFPSRMIESRLNHGIVPARMNLDSAARLCSLIVSAAIEARAPRVTIDVAELQAELAAARSEKEAAIARYEDLARQNAERDSENARLAAEEAHVAQAKDSPSGVFVPLGSSALPGNTSGPEAEQSTPTSPSSAIAPSPVVPAPRKSTDDASGVARDPARKSDDYESRRISAKKEWLYTTMRSLPATALSLVILFAISRNLPASMEISRRQGARYLFLIVIPILMVSWIIAGYPRVKARRQGLGIKWVRELASAKNLPERRVLLSTGQELAVPSQYVKVTYSFLLDRLFDVGRVEILGIGEVFVTSELQNWLTPVGHRAVGRKVLIAGDVAWLVSVVIILLVTGISILGLASP